MICRNKTPLIGAGIRPFLGDLYSGFYIILAYWNLVDYLMNFFYDISGNSGNKTPFRMKLSAREGVVFRHITVVPGRSSSNCFVLYVNANPAVRLIWVTF